MSLVLDWWQLGWALAGFFGLMFFVLAVATWNHGKKALEAGYEQGVHDRKHWETDQIVKGKLKRQ